MGARLGRVAGTGRSGGGARGRVTPGTTRWAVPSACVPVDRPRVFARVSASPLYVGGEYAHPQPVDKSLRQLRSGGPRQRVFAPSQTSNSAARFVSNFVRMRVDRTASSRAGLTFLRPGSTGPSRRSDRKDRNASCAS